eukprot:2108590-Amphidinium_carterae.1
MERYMAMDSTRHFARTFNRVVTDSSDRLCHVHTLPPNGDEYLISEHTTSESKTRDARVDDSSQVEGEVAPSIQHEEPIERGATSKRCGTVR